MRRRKNYTITLAPPPELTSEDRMVADCVGMNPPPANNMDPSPPWSKFITTKSNSTAMLRLLFLQIPIDHSFFALNISHPQSRTILFQKLSQFIHLAIHSVTFLPIGNPLDFNFFFFSRCQCLSLSLSLPPVWSLINLNFRIASSALSCMNCKAEYTHSSTGPSLKKTLANTKREGKENRGGVTECTYLVHERGGVDVWHRFWDRRTWAVDWILLTMAGACSGRADSFGTVVNATCAYEVRFSKIKNK